MSKNEKEKQTIDIEFIDQLVDSKSDENTIDFKWSEIHKEDEEEIAKTNLIENLLKKADYENYPKK